MFVYVWVWIGLAHTQQGRHHWSDTVCVASHRLYIITIVFCIVTCHEKPEFKRNSMFMFYFALLKNRQDFTIYFKFCEYTWCSIKLNLIISIWSGNTSHMVFLCIEQFAVYSCCALYAILIVISKVIIVFFLLNITYLISHWCEIVVCDHNYNPAFKLLYCEHYSS